MDIFVLAQPRERDSSTLIKRFLSGKSSYKISNSKGNYETHTIDSLRSFAYPQPYFGIIKSEDSLDGSPFFMASKLTCRETMTYYGKVFVNSLHTIYLGTGYIVSYYLEDFPFHLQSCTLPEKRAMLRWIKRILRLYYLPLPMGKKMLFRFIAGDDNTNVLPSAALFLGRFLGRFDYTDTLGALRLLSDNANSLNIGRNLANNTMLYIIGRYFSITPQLKNSNQISGPASFVLEHLKEYQNSINYSQMRKQIIEFKDSLSPLSDLHGHLERYFIPAKKVNY